MDWKVTWNEKYLKWKVFERKSERKSVQKKSDEKKNIIKGKEFITFVTLNKVILQEDYIAFSFDGVAHNSYQFSYGIYKR